MPSALRVWHGVPQLLVLLLALLPGWMVAGAAASPIPLLPKLSLLATLALGVFAPTAALALGVALIPVAGLWAQGQGVPRWSEAIACAAAAGLTIRWLRRRPERSSDVLAPAVLLGGLAVVSAAVVLAAQAPFLPDRPVLGGLADAFGTWPKSDGHLRFFDDAALLLVGMLLLVTATAFIGPHEQHIVLRMAVAGSTGVAALTLTRVLGAVLRSNESLLEVAVPLLTSMRYHATHGDLNAAGSYYVLTTMITAGLLRDAWVARRRGAAVALGACFALQCLALWFTGSRAAQVTLVVVLLGFTLALVWHRVPRGVRVASVAAAAVAVLLAGVAIVRWSPNQIELGGTIHFRVEMARTSLRMLADAPWFGIGIGRYYELSGAYIESPAVRHYFSHENAHNNLLQLTAELGIVGGAAFVWVLWRSLRRRSGAAPAAHRALMFGLGGFLLTSLTGHPLLTAEVAYPFWIAVGMASAGGTSVIRRHRLHAASLALSVVVLALAVATAPGRALEARAISNLDHGSYDTSRWQTDRHGVRYREFQGHGTFFIWTDAEIVEALIHVDQPGRVTLGVQWNGRAGGDISLLGGDWRRVSLRVPPNLPGRYAELRLELLDPRHPDPLLNTVRITKFGILRMKEP
ncbi:MAG TPA: O-antigen ligase family protein [Vicinamibacterales bacterium]|nr:O-antigen ligase family protein [Vicinamibacterales bacterium]